MPDIVALVPKLCGPLTSSSASSAQDPAAAGAGGPGLLGLAAGGLGGGALGASSASLPGASAGAGVAMDVAAAVAGLGAGDLLQQEQERVRAGVPAKTGGTGLLGSYSYGRSGAARSKSGSTRSSSNSWRAFTSNSSKSTIGSFSSSSTADAAPGEGGAEENDVYSAGSWHDSTSSSSAGLQQEEEGSHGAEAAAGGGGSRVRTQAYSSSISHRRARSTSPAAGVVRGAPSFSYAHRSTSPSASAFPSAAPKPAARHQPVALPQEYDELLRSLMAQ